MDHETDWDRLFKAARQAHESGQLNQALELYAAVGRQNPYYPGLEGHMRALEVQMTHGDGSDRPAAAHISPYLVYGAGAFLPPFALTWFIASTTGWDPLFTWLVAHNVITFLVYGYDKLIAPSGIMRVPESILLLEVLTGAFVGAPLACELFRHKTQKLPFRQKFWIAEIIAVAWVVIYYGVLALRGYSWSL
jgi:uncharacterized membrane protein YsdA (DUF1294 family)